MILRDEITNVLAKAIKKLDLSADKLAVSFSNRPELCDFQTNFALIIAKELGRKPIEVANEIVENLQKTELFEFSAVMPGFINVKVTEKGLNAYANDVLQDKNLGVEQVKKPRLVMFDYGGANVAKELHVGHLRSPIVGEAIKRLHVAMGDKVLADVHLGDYGLQMGLTVLQLKEDGYLDAFFDGKQKNVKLENVTLDLLNEEYPKASKRKDVDEDFKKKADEYTLYIQQHKEPYFEIYNQIKSLSVAEIKKNYELLNTTFDLYLGESDAYPFIDETIKIFIDKGLARESEGALVVDVAKEGEHIPIPKKTPDEPQRYKNPMPPAIIKKYNGGDLYATTDIATIMMRNRDYNPDEIVYVTDNRQSGHFEQVFRCCKLAGISPEGQKLTHVAFGTMNGSDGKPFKTRAGGTVKYKDVLNMLIESANKKLSDNGIVGDLELARKIGVGAMKFGDLSNTVAKDYVFDMDKFLAFDGKTGPYIQYTIARINSILAKFNGEVGQIDVKSEEERNIVLSVLKLNSSYQVCYENYSLNALCLSAFDLASAFSTLYNNTKILSEKDEKRKQNLISVCVFVKKCLEKALWVLGIDSVNKM
ncbi:MAG: arginine--tRNA ligase [Clostridia bacterium]|nr:arginine--tRNA ligase [Clostridia bacterium]